MRNLVFAKAISTDCCALFRADSDPNGRSPHDRARRKHADYEAMHKELLTERLASLLQIRETAAQHGLALQLTKLTPGELRGMPKPVIAHLDIVHVNGHVVYVDGTTAETRTTPWADFQRDWSGAIAYHPRGIVPGRWGQLMALVAGFVSVHLARHTGRIAHMFSRRTSRRAGLKDAGGTSS